MNHELAKVIPLYDLKKRSWVNIVRTEMDVKEETDASQPFPYVMKREKTNQERRIVKSRNAKLIVVGLVLLNILLLCALLGLVIQWRILRIKAQEPTEHEICQPCADLDLTENELPESIRGKISRERSNDRQSFDCCGKASEVLDWMVKKAVEKRRNDYVGDMFPLVSDKCSKTIPVVPSAQVNGLSLFQITSEHKLIHWNHTDGAFFKGGIKYHHGKLTVAKAGFYYIFSQIKFKQTPLPKTDESVVNYNIEGETSISHFIYHTSAKTGIEEKILESSKSKCEMATTEGSGETTNIMGAVFQLEEGDEIFVKTSHPEILVPCKESNFFGLYMT